MFSSCHFNNVKHIYTPAGVGGGWGGTLIFFVYTGSNPALALYPK